MATNAMGARRPYRLRTACGFILAILIFACAAPIASAAAYSATVLYQLSATSGFVVSGPQLDTQAAADGQVGGADIAGTGHALLWNGASAAINLNPSTFTSSLINATTGTFQVGSGVLTSSGNSNALLWSGAIASAINLQPLTGFASSSALGADATNQVGSGEGTSTSGNAHALLWSGTAVSAIDLNPTNLAGISNSFAQAVSGSQQVGYGYGTGTDFNNNALLWTGSASTAVNLNPTALLGPASGDESEALGVSGGEQVGWGSGSITKSNPHALLWLNTAASAVDLNPTNLTGITSSYAIGASAAGQVGWGEGSGTGGNWHALLWNGQAHSAVDLESLLSGSFVSSRAYSINAAGDVFGVGTDGLGNTYAIEWTPVPEPSAMMILASAFGLLLKRRGPQA